MDSSGTFMSSNDYIIEMDNSMIWNGQKSFSIAKETQELLKNVSRHCGDH